MTDSPAFPRSARPGLASPVSLALALALASLLAVPPAGAQEPGGPPPPRNAPAGGDRLFINAQILRAMDEKASILLEQGKTEAAMEELRRAFAIDLPKDSPAYELKAHLIGRFAMTLAETGKKKEALETIQRLLADVAPGSVAEASAWLDAGAVYRRSGMPDEALKAFDRSIELSQKLARTRGPAGPPLPQPPGRPARPPQSPPRGDPR